MFRVLFGAALLTLPAASVGGGPMGPPPRVMVAVVDRGGRAWIETYVNETRFEVTTVKVKVGEREEERQVKVPVTVTRKSRLALDAAGVRLMTAGGKEIEPRNVRAVLKKTSPVLVSADGRDVDPVYLRLARPDTL